MNDDNIQKLTEDKTEFLKYAKKVDDTFNGPSAYFYKKVINKIRSTDNYSSLFDNELFFEDVYATLATWGMHRGGNTRMADFNDFKKSIRDNTDFFVRLSKEKLEKTNLEDLREVILKIFDSLLVMERKEAPKFVANSKIMHYLLPDLIPPMDRKYIASFFYIRFKKENNDFWEVLSKFKEIAVKLNLTQDDLKNEWDISIPKIIDNAIIGFNRKQRDDCKQQKNI
jgi:hypothetical protein